MGRDKDRKEREGLRMEIYRERGRMGERGTEVLRSERNIDRERSVQRGEKEERIS